MAIDEQTRFTNPYLVLCHSRCGSSTEWEPLPPIRTTRGSYCSVATPANRCGLPSSHGYTSARVRNNQQGSFDRDEEGEPAVHVLGVSLGFDRHENMVGQLGRRMKRRSYNCGKNPEKPCTTPSSFTSNVIIYMRPSIRVYLRSPEVSMRRIRISEREERFCAREQFCSSLT